MQKPNKLYIEEKIKSHPFTVKVLNKLNPIPVELVEDYKKIGEEKPFPVRAEEDKSALALAERKGEFLKNVGRMERGEFYLFHEIDCWYDCQSAISLFKNGLEYSGYNKLQGTHILRLAQYRYAFLTFGVLLLSPSASLVRVKEETGGQACLARIT